MYVFLSVCLSVCVLYEAVLDNKTKSSSPRPLDSRSILILIKTTSLSIKRITDCSFKILLRLLKYSRRFLNHKMYSILKEINNGNLTEWSAWSEIIRVI